MNIFGVNLIGSRFVYIELTKIYGIGIKSSLKICMFSFTFFKRVNDLNSNNIDCILYLISMLKTGLELRKNIYNNILRLIRIKCYRGIRHFKGLPVRGQRTRTNSKTVRKIRLKL